MSLLTLIQKGGLGKVATATTATLATHGAEKAGTVAPVATVAVAKPQRPEVELAKRDMTLRIPAPSVADTWSHEDWLDWINERSAILEFDGGCPREDANDKAFLMWCRNAEHGREG